MDLRQATRQLMGAHDTARWLKLADNYMQTYRKLPSSFILPAEHAVLKPIIDAFANDTKAFVMYIKAIRDGAKGAAGFEELHELYRTIDIRVLQGERRDRIRKATQLLQKEYEPKLGRPMSYDEQMVLAKFVESAWKVMRIEDASIHRAMRKAKSMTLEEQEIVYDQFWNRIQADLDNGKVSLGERQAAVDEYIEKLASQGAEKPK